MTRDEAEELIERIPYINTNSLMIANDRIRLEMYYSVLNSEDPVEWVRLVKTDYIRRNDKNIRKHPSKEEVKIALSAKSELYKKLAMALEIQTDRVEAYIVKSISESW